MELNEAWEKALSNTEIIRTRIQGLMTFADTHVPYILLSESSLHLGDTLVRKGEVMVEKPALFLPPNIPQFQGFDFGKESGLDKDAVINFLLIRGVTIPSLKYNNKTHALNIYEGRLKDAIAHYAEELQRTEDVHTGLIIGPEDCWQFSMLIFICAQAAKNVDTDIRRIIEEYKKRNRESNS